MNVNVQRWATAISTHSSNGRKIIWRFAQELSPEFVPESLPDRIIIIWKYESETGLPLQEDHDRMNMMEDLLEAITEEGSFATLALVSTGEGLREWTYYSKSADDFIHRLNELLAKQPLFPIEVATANDPSWSMYREFRTKVKESATEPPV